MIEPCLHLDMEYVSAGTDRRTDRLSCVSLRRVSLKEDLRDEESSTHVNTKIPKCIAPFVMHFCTIEHVSCCKETDLLLLLAQNSFWAFFGNF